MPLRCGLSERGPRALQFGEWTRTRIHSQRGANAWTLNGMSAPAPPFPHLIWNDELAAFEYLNLLGKVK